MQSTQSEPQLPLATEAAQPRRQQTILFADMVNYTERTEKQELATLDFMSRCFDTLRVLTRRFRCTLVKTTGDGALVIFDEAVDAVEYSVEFQSITEKMQRGDNDPCRFRIGVHQGEVILRNGDVFGMAVNIAARLQELAPPGGCVVSQPVYQSVGLQSGYLFESIGAPVLKHISERVQVYRVLTGQDHPVPETRSALPCIHVMDAPHIRFADGSIATVPPVTAGALLAYLALTPGCFATNERLRELFWPSRETAAGRRAIGQAVALLRRRLAGAGDMVRRERDWVALNETAFETDLDLIEAGLRRGIVDQRLLDDGDWPEQILSSVETGTPALAGWVRIVRSAWRRRILVALERILDQEPAHSETFARAADAMLLLEPGNEVASYARIAHNLERDNRGAALEEYDRLNTYLMKEYDVAPSDRILSAIRAALRGQAPRGGPFARPEGGERRRRLLRILVQAFGDDSGGNRVSAFRSELIANLARFRDWSVLDATGHEADYDISGIATTDAEEVRLDLRLHKLPDKRVLWSEHVELTRENWGDIQRRILRRITAELESHISTDRLRSTLQQIGREPTMHDAWLRGDMMMMRWTPEGFEEARAIFAGILEEDSDHVPALTSLASMTNIKHLVWPGIRRSADELREADRIARHAVEVDSMDPRVHRVVAWTAAYNGSFERALVHVDRAIALNPNSPVTLSSCALAYAWFGEREKADAALTRLMAITRDLSPWLWSYLSVVYYFLDRLDDALRAVELSEEQIVDTQGWIAAIEARRGNHEAAATAFDALVSRVRDVWRGDDPADPEAVAAWFTSAFPIRHGADREKLVQPIMAVLNRR